MTAKTYTLEVYKTDRRTRDGERQVLKQDYTTDNLGMLEHTVKHTWPASRFRTVIRETYVTRTNAMTGEKFQERYDTPYFCSPSSESYWSN